MAGMSDALSVARDHWSKPLERPARTRWWESPAVVRHVNRNICGQPVPGTAGADIAILRGLGPFRRAISVGCGNAYHEIQLLQWGIVERFDLYELSPPRAELAGQWAQKHGVADRVTVHLQDAFTTPDAFDLVYWKDALHHMFSARDAVRWSRDVLSPEGVFFASEFVGPTRMQYSDRQLDMAARARAWLPECYRLGRDGKPAPDRRQRPSLEGMIAADPSECADSANILPAVRDLFPDAEARRAGGIVYMLALNDILANFAEDDPMLAAMLTMDDLCVEAGESLYATTWARKRA